MTLRDLSDLEKAVHLICLVLERQHIQEENATERRGNFRLLTNEEESPHTGEKKLR